MARLLIKAKGVDVYRQVQDQREAYVEGPSQWRSTSFSDPNCDAYRLAAATFGPGFKIEGSVSFYDADR